LRDGLDLALADNPNAGDRMALDDIVITPAPATLSLLVLGTPGWTRRR